MPHRCFVKGGSVMSEWGLEEYIYLFSHTWNKILTAPLAHRLLGESDELWESFKNYKYFIIVNLWVMITQHLYNLDYWLFWIYLYCDLKKEITILLPFWKFVCLFFAVLQWVNRAYQNGRVESCLLKWNPC